MVTSIPTTAQKNVNTRTYHLPPTTYNLYTQA